MADARSKQPKINENPLIAELIARGAENSSVLRGFIGPSRDDRYVTLYQSLARLGDTVEIPREAVIHVVDAPGSSLGAVVVWIKDDAQISVRRAQSDAAHPKAGPGAKMQEVTKGRLRMQLGPARGGATCLPADDVCVSWCDCSICQSICLTVAP